MTKMKALASCLLALFVVACGGGGGGSKDGSSAGELGAASAQSTFAVTLDKTALRYSFETSAPGEAQKVVATATGQLPSSLYFAAVVDGDSQAINKNIPIYLTGSGADIYVRANDMPAGHYTGQVHLYACSDQACTHPIGGTPLHVSFDVTVAPRLQALPQALSLVATEHTSTSVAHVLLTPDSLPAGGALTYEVQYTDTSSGWLSVSPNAQGMDLTASATSLLQGQYTAQVRITPPLPNTPVIFPVTLTVGQGLVRPVDQSLTADVNATLSSLSGNVPVQLSQGDAVTWQATTDAPWLRLIGARGRTGDSLQYGIDLDAFKQLGNFASHKAMVTITPDVATMTPVRFAVTLSKALPDLQFAGPYLLVAGQAAPLRLRGRGLTASPAVLPWLQTDGSTPSQVALASDTLIQLKLPAQTVGTRSFRVSNALGVDTGKVDVRVVAPQTYGYAAIAHAGLKRVIAYDAERRAVYTVNTSNNSLTRFRFRNGSWTTDSAAISDIHELGLGPDGRELIVLGSRRIHLLDPDTLSTNLSIDFPDSRPQGFNYLGNVVAATDDGCSWFLSDAPWGAGLTCFNHLSRSLVAVQAPPAAWPTGGALLSAARNGERLLIAQAGFVSSYYDLYLNSGETEFHVVPAPGLPNTPQPLKTWAQASLDGGRVVAGMARVLDASFNTVGLLNMPAVSSPYFQYARDAVMSPDGKRAYVLAYVYQDTMASLTMMPRVYVFDTSQPVGLNTGLPLLGTITLNDYPSCRVLNGDGGCAGTARMTIAPDGRTLFIVGDAAFIVAPIANSLSGMVN